MASAFSSSSFPRKRESIRLLHLKNQIKVDSRLRGNDGSFIPTQAA